jgi:hypothetical protein
VRADAQHPLGCDPTDKICVRREECQKPLFRSYVERGTVIGGYRILTQAGQRAAEEAQLAGTTACKEEEDRALTLERRAREAKERGAKAIKEGEELLREIDEEKKKEARR